MVNSDMIKSNGFSKLSYLHKFKALLPGRPRPDLVSSLAAPPPPPRPPPRRKSLPNNYQRQNKMQRHTMITVKPYDN